MREALEIGQDELIGALEEYVLRHCSNWGDCEIRLIHQPNDKNKFVAVATRVLVPEDAKQDVE